MTQEAAALLASLLAAIVLGYLTLRSQTRIARARLTFDAMNRNNWDKDYINHRTKFVDLRNDTAKVILYAHKLSDVELQAQLGIDRAEYDTRKSTIRSVLNNHENLAIGIRRGILDEEYLYRFMRGIVVVDWQNMSPFVAVLRQEAENPLIYAEFEGLATQWQNSRSYFDQTKRMPKLQRHIAIR